MSVAAASSSSSAASSVSFIKGADVPKILIKWLQQLAADQKEADERERVITQKNIAKLITREFIKRGIGAHCPVSKAIAKLKEAQQKEGDTPELAEALKVLPDKWLAYTILLQEAAPGYFRQNSVNTPNFTTLYFDQITFLTLWNDIWRSHFHIAAGGQELKLLNDIQNEFMSMPDMSKQEQDQEMKARPRTGAPQDVFNFSQHDMQAIIDTVKRATEHQQIEEAAITENLSTILQDHFEFHTWMSKIHALTKDVVQATQNDQDGFIVENGEATPIREMRAVLQAFIAQLKGLDPKQLANDETHAKMKGFANTVLDKEWALFQTALNQKEWQDAYREYILAYTEWSKALKMLELFDAINQRMEEAMLHKSLAPPKEIIDTVPAYIDNAFVLNLKGKMEAAKEKFTQTEATVKQHALQRDRARYMMTVEEQLRLSVRLVTGDHQKVLELVDKIGRELDSKVEVDVRQRFAHGGDIGCRAIITLREKKAEIRQNLYASQGIGHTFPREPEMKSAEAICVQMETIMDQVMKNEAALLQMEVDVAASRQRSPPTLLNSELMKRSLMPTFTRKGKKALEEVYQKIVGLNILTGLTSHQLIPDSPQVALDPIETSLMQKYSMDSQSPSSFGELTRYALWLMWVLHKDHLNTMERPLTTDASSESS